MIEFSFTSPPSTNALYSGRRYRTQRYKVWQQEAGWQIRMTPGRCLKGPFVLHVWLPPGIDLDNIKAVADLLGPGEHGLGITADDRYMVELHVYRDPQATQCRVRIEGRL